MSRDVRTRTVDLIVTEVLLPGMDGFELLQQLRYIPNAPHVILLTTKDDLVTRVAALELGGP